MNGKNHLVTGAVLATGGNWPDSSSYAASGSQCTGPGARARSKSSSSQ